MKKIAGSVGLILLLLFIAFEILTESPSILSSVTFSFQIWKNNLVPSMFPIFVLSELLIQYGFPQFLGELCKPLMHIFRMKGSGAFIFIMSIISGFPSNAKYTRELYLKKELTKEEASKILTFTHFSNPLFILGTISILFLNNKEAGLLILLCHYLSNIIIGLLFRNYHPSEKENNKVSFKKAILMMHKKRINNDKNFGQIITNSLMNSINTLLLILGVVTMFLVITTILNNILPFNNYYQSILNGFFEMSQGLKYVSLLEIPLKLKSSLSAMIISFGGLSVHMQMIGILSDTKIKYTPFFTARILHAVLAGISVFFLFDAWIRLF